jgi:hypothetical protein
MGMVSLWRSYRTTLLFYTGQFTSGTRQVAVSPVAVKSAPGKDTLMEKDLPWLSEQATAITLGSFRSMTRAPEAKMLLLTPIILVVVFGGMALRQSMDIPESVRPLLAFGGMSFILLSMVQLVGNQFGFDRNGFRVFVLSGVPRRDVLLGKNLAFAPLSLGLGLLLALLVQAVCPMRWDHFLSLLPQLVSMYLLFCMLANWLSIFAPVLIAAGSLKMSTIKGIPLLLHIGFVFVFPLALVPTLFPLGFEVLMNQLGWAKGLPICLFLSLLGCVGIVFLYGAVVAWQGRVLHSREQKILAIVTTKED